MKTIKAFFFCILLVATAAAQPIRLTRAIKAEVVSSLSKSLEANYIYLDTANRMGQFVQQQLRKGAYDTIQTPSVFAQRLTNDLLSVYHDGHLSVDFDPQFADASGVADTLAEQARRLAFRKRVNFGFDKEEILPGNIGYLKIGGFFAPDADARVMTEAAFRFVSNSKALLIDLRENHGGDPRMVSYICGFLFSDKTHLNDLYTRNGGSTDQFWAIPDSTLKTLRTIPVYILTSRETFSAGEELSYDLQTQKRAIVVGEPSGGGAHPVSPYPIGKGFVANIPFARAINPVTKTNWEATGVQPDYMVPAADALPYALKMINN